MMESLISPTLPAGPRQKHGNALFTLKKSAVDSLIAVSGFFSFADSLAHRVAKMSKGCITATKYFLFLFNLLFFPGLSAAVQFISGVLSPTHLLLVMLAEEESNSLKVGSYILIGVGSLSMLMGFLGCIGAIYEVRCLLGLYFTCLLLILIAQMTAAVLIYFQRDLLKNEMSIIVNKILVDYTIGNKTTEQAWDYIQRTMQCCGWTGPSNWTENTVIKNSSRVLYPCSCRNVSIPGVEVEDNGLCESLSQQPPVYQTGCISSVESWLFSNYGVIIGICAGVAVIEVLRCRCTHTDGCRACVNTLVLAVSMCTPTVHAMIPRDFHFLYSPYISPVWSFDLLVWSARS
ncbi:CD82 antigen-like [Scleropages formosus]|uniref:CD82 antigen-like n=1 Tax=Scleropages formosus TaxID=113540 RepID=A0A0P7UXN4_SCLFO|nr:CD82 antigen-like [Scleropages formosus]